MAEMDDSGAIFGDLAAPNPSPRAFISHFFNEDACSRPYSGPGDSGFLGFMESENQKTAMCSEEEVEKPDLDPSSDIFLDPVMFDPPKSSSRGALSERMVARAGFSTLTVNTSRNGEDNMIPFPSPGVSPTTLLESPVFLSNSMAQLSPTTGKFPFNPFSALISEKSDNSNAMKMEEFHPMAFSFPRLCSNLPLLQQSEYKAVGQKRSLTDMDASLKPDWNHQPGFTESSETKEISPSTDDNQIGEKDQKGGLLSSISVSAPVEDGYNWRKYGQKQVKGSEFPRSYYKCTSPNCPVTKKVERSSEGHVIEIIYKGAHNHLKPPPSRRSSCTFGESQMDSSDYIVLHSSYEGKVGMEAASPASVPDLPASNSMNLSSVLSNDDEEDDGGTRDGFSVGCNADGDEMDSKRRKQDLGHIDMSSAAARAMREPRVVVQTTSEVDVLDDGYRWRKYGQKVVKGNPNPRSYYKCTQPSCTVRKHVERASHDLKSVITTYEGKHNHEVPAAKNGVHQNSFNSPAAGMLLPLSLRHRAEASSQDSFMGFESLASTGHYTLPHGVPQLGTGNGFALGFDHFSGLGPMGPMRMPLLSPFHPKREVKEETAPKGCYQFANRLPLGPFT